MTFDDFQTETLRTAIRPLDAYPKLVQMTVEALAKAGLTRDAERILKQWDIMTFSLGLAGESGEVCDLIKKVQSHGLKLDEQSAKLGKTPRAAIKEELGDVLWYVSVLAHMYSFSLDEIASENNSKLRSRYPNGWSVERANV